MKIIGKAWKDYEAKVLPKDAPDVQRMETRRAFYAGALAYFVDGDIRDVLEHKAELDQFALDVKEGRA